MRQQLMCSFYCLCSQNMVHIIKIKQQHINYKSKKNVSRLECKRKKPVLDKLWPLLSSSQ